MKTQMTKSEIFKAAHKLAKSFEGDYRACFALALKEVYSKKPVSALERAKAFVSDFEKRNGKLF